MFEPNIYLYRGNIHRRLSHDITVAATSHQRKTTATPNKLSRPTVRARICEAVDHTKKTLVAALDKVKFVATTTDCWSAHQKSYLGVTCHWIEEESLERRSAALACKRLRRSHTFDMLAGALDDVHCQYKIRGNHS